MIRALAAITALVAAFWTFALEPAAAQDRYGKQKVVYHINFDGGQDAGAYVKALKNVQNHINAVGKDNIEVKIVVHGDGIHLLRDAVNNQKVQTEITSLKTQNTSFAVCANTLKAKNINFEKDLFEVGKEDIVPSGVAELSYLQGKGYTYIKP